MANPFLIIDDNIDDIFLFIIKNDNIKKLLGNSSKLAIEEPIPDENWYDEYLLDTPRIPNVTDEMKSFIVIQMDNTSVSGNVYNYDVVYDIDVICHESVWRLKKGRRPYKLCAYIDDEMKNIKTTSIKGEFTYIRTSKIVYSNEFQGFRMKYGVTNNSSKCR